MTQTWITSDIHIGHVNIIAYSGRPFADVPEMNESIVDYWNSTVGPDDTVYVLGDMAMGKMDVSLPIVGQLHGVKILVPGNHDRCHPNFSGKQGTGHWLGRYADVAGFDIIEDVQTRIDIGHAHGIRVCHFPYSGDHTGEEDRYTELRPRDDGEWLVHGHVHDAWRQNGRQINVGIDAWGGHILPVEVVADIIAKGDQTAWLDRIDWPTNGFPLEGITNA